jgi:hypothetical protein
VTRWGWAHSQLLPCACGLLLRLRLHLSLLKCLQQLRWAVGQRVVLLLHEHQVPLMRLGLHHQHAEPWT